MPRNFYAKRLCLIAIKKTAALLIGCLGAAVTFAAVPCMAAPTQAAPPTEINVKDYGAGGTGASDDTNAFLKTIAAAKAKGLPVRVPRGTYSITKTIPVENMEIEGAATGAWPADTDALPSILDKVADGPCFQMLQGGSLHGLDITYSRERDANFKYAAVLVVGGGVYISNMRIRYAYDGIAADGLHNVGRLNVENVFMVAIQHDGVRVTGTYDVPRLANVEVWNAGLDKAPLTTGVGFRLGHNDGMRMTDCFVFAMNTGYLFEKTGLNELTRGTTKGSMNGCSSDYCVTGVMVNGLPLAKINYPSEMCLLAENSTAKVAGQNYGSYFLGPGTGPGGNNGSAPYTTGLGILWYSGNDTPTTGDVPPTPPTFPFLAFASPLARHSGGANIVYADGHVKWLTFNAIYNPPTGVDKTQFKLWHPDAK